MIDFPLISEIAAGDQGSKNPEGKTNSTLEGIDVLVFAVRHKPYFDLNPEMVFEKAGKPIAVVDCFGILDDDKIRRYLQLGCEVKGLGRGHIRRLKEQVKKAEG